MPPSCVARVAHKDHHRFFFETWSESEQLSLISIELYALHSAQRAVLASADMFKRPYLRLGDGFCQFSMFINNQIVYVQTNLDLRDQSCSKFSRLLIRVSLHSK